MKFRSPQLLIALSEEKSITPDVQIMRVGTFYSDEHGKIDITPQMLQNMVKNFHDQVRGIDLAIDYKHDSDDIAAGWIKELYTLNEGKELWAKVDWTPKGSKIVGDKEFRYLSADFHLNFKHNETNKEYGPTLFGAGLTNRPFIKEMDPVINLSENAKGTEMDEKDKKIAELEAKIADMQKQIDAAGKEESQEGDSAQADDSQMADLKKMNADLQAKCAAFEKDAKAAAEAKKLSEKNSSFDKLLGEGKVVEAQRAHFMSGDTVKFAEASVPTNLSGIGSSNSPAPEAGSKEEAIAEIEKLSLELSEKEKVSLSVAQHRVLMENKELAKRIYS